MIKSLGACLIIANTAPTRAIIGGTGHNHILNGISFVPFFNLLTKAAIATRAYKITISTDVKVMAETTEPKKVRIQPSNPIKRTDAQGVLKRGWILEKTLFTGFGQDWSLADEYRNLEN